MHVLRLIIILCLLAQSVSFASATDITGTWISKYSFDSVEEVMTANIKQIGENIIGSFSVKPSVGSSYSGVIFGTINGDQVKSNYLSVRASENKDPQVVITFRTYALGGTFL
ncbi:MAG: hypothetical protein WB392_10175 [Methanotrichaceae archaeon]